MLNRVIPNIHNGHRQLILTETLSFMPNDGLIITIPTLNESTGIQSNITLQFTFINKEAEPISVKQSAENNTLLLTFVNFNNSLGAGNTTPFFFNFGNVQYSLLIFTKSLTNKENPKDTVYTMTFSIYSEAKK